MKKGGIRIEPIKNGTVIDHISPGKALKILRFLEIPNGVNMGVASNVASQKYKKKDLIFIEDMEMSEQDIAKISLISKTATLNIVRAGKVVKKTKLTPPSFVEGIFHCPNPQCISNHEAIKPRFHIIKENENTYLAKCYYCEIVLSESEVEERLL